MSINTNPFTPGLSASRTVSGSSARVALPGGQGDVLRILNDATATAFFKFGDVTVEAAVTDTPILAGMSEVFTYPANATYIAAIGTSGTLRITRGYGY